MAVWKRRLPPARAAPAPDGRRPAAPGSTAAATPRMPQVRATHELPAAATVGTEAGRGRRQGQETCSLPLGCFAARTQTHSPVGGEAYSSEMGERTTFADFHRKLRSVSID